MAAPEYDRRRLLASGLVAMGAATVLGAQADPLAPSEGSVTIGDRAIRFADLTHRLTRAFSFGQVPPRMTMEPVDGSGKAAGMKLNRVSIIEHTGTHIDAPRHFSDTGASLGEIPLPDLIVPLAVIDMRERFAADHNAALEPADVERWEARYGRLPEGCCIAMWSGIDPLADAPERRVIERIAGPGFSPDLGRMLLSQRSVKGIALDAMSLDTAPNMPTYPFHREWLHSGRWGLEGLTNLASVPPAGGVLVVGAAPMAQATGLPVRAIALF